VGCQPVDQVLADEAGATEDANCFMVHVCFLPGKIRCLQEKCQGSILG
jgi:hypothetical protein